MPCRCAWVRSSAPTPGRCERDAERIRRSAEGLRRLGIGGTATGSGLNAHPEYHARMVQRLSELTGLELYYLG